MLMDREGSGGIGFSFGHQCVEFVPDLRGVGQILIAASSIEILDFLVQRVEEWGVRDGLVVAFGHEEAPSRVRLRGQTLFESVVTACENGGRRLPVTTQLGYTRAQADAIQRLKNAKDNHERLGVTAHASKHVQHTTFTRCHIVQ